jgi:hypothetical protein
MKKLFIKQRISGWMKIFFEKHKKVIFSLVEIFGMSLMISLSLAVALDYYNFYVYVCSIGIYFVYKEIVKDLRIVFKR